MIPIGYPFAPCASNGLYLLDVTRPPSRPFSTTARSVRLDKSLPAAMVYCLDQLAQIAIFETADDPLVVPAFEAQSPRRIARWASISSLSISSKGPLGTPK